MSIWKRIRDAIGALAEGEPLSAVFERLTTPPERTVAFTIAVIALGAKMAKADGRVTRDEISAFRRVFHIPKEDEASAARVYNMARTEVAGFDSYAHQMARMFRDRPKVLADAARMIPATRQNKLLSLHGTPFFPFIIVIQGANSTAPRRSGSNGSTRRGSCVASETSPKLPGMNWSRAD